MELPELRTCDRCRVNCAGPRSPRLTPGLLTSSWQLCRLLPGSEKFSGIQEPWPILALTASPLRCDPTSSQSRRGAFQQVVVMVLWNTVGPCQSCTCRGRPDFPSSRAYLRTTKLHSYSRAAAKCSARRFEMGEGGILTLWMDTQALP